MSYIPPLIDDQTMAQTTAKILLEIEAVHFRADDPFTLTSGRQSPVYIDCRKIISFPRARSVLMDFVAAKILRNIGFENLDGIAGGETAGIPFAALVAERLGLAMQYVRKKPKGFGRGARIEGDFKEGDHILLMEDLASEGSSKLNFIEALRAAGAQANHSFVLFYYDIFDGAIKDLEAHNIKLHYLATWWDVLAEARQNSQTYTSAELDKVEAFLRDPNGWSAS